MSMKITGVKDAREFMSVTVNTVAYRDKLSGVMDSGYSSCLR